MRLDQALACVRKVGFKHKRQAEREVSRLQQQNRERGIPPDGGDGHRPLVVYLCPNCKRWHIGHGARI